MQEDESGGGPEKQMETGSDTSEWSGLSLGRIMSFSDGVFAVAITLLVLSIKVPFVPQSVADQKLPHEIVKLIPIIEAYIISFLIIGLFWVGHHQVFSRFRRHDRGLMWINLVFLMTIVFIPFPTSLISEYPSSRAAFIFYACSLALAGIMITALSWYGMHYNRLVDVVDSKFYRRFSFGYLDMAAIFLLSIPFSYLNVRFAKYFWLLIIPTNWYFDHVMNEKLVKRRAAKGDNGG